MTAYLLGVTSTGQPVIGVWESGVQLGAAAAVTYDQTVLDGVHHNMIAFVDRYLAANGR